VNTQEQIENLEKQIVKLNRLKEEKDEMVIEFSDRLIKVLKLPSHLILQMGEYIIKISTAKNRQILARYNAHWATRK